jgi:hypothetical protein
MPDQGGEIRLALIMALAALKAGKITPAEALEVDRQVRQAQTRR